MSIQEILALIGSGSTAAVLLIVLLYALTNSNFASWFEFVTKIRNRKIEYPQAFLQENDEISPETRAILRDVSEARLLQRTIGVYAETNTRKHLLELHRQTSGTEIDWRTIRLTFPRLKTTDERIRVCPENSRQKILLTLSWISFLITLIALTFCLIIAEYLFIFDPSPETIAMGIIFVMYTVFLSFASQLPNSYIRTSRAAKQIDVALKP